MKNKLYFKNNINNQKDFSLQAEIMMIAFKLGIIVGLIAFFLNIILNLGTMASIVPLLIAVVSLFLYYISKYKNKLEIASYITISALSFVFYPTLWFINGGSYGGIIYFYLFNTTFIAILLSNFLRKLIFILNILTVISLFFLEYLFPNSIVLYETSKSKYLDQAVSFLIVFIFLFLLIRWILNIYDQKINELNEAHAELNIAYDKLKIISITDALSEIYNRRHTFDLLEKLFKDKNSNEKISILMIDIDHFKKINDKYGHSTGDEVIRKVAKILKCNIKETDFVGRIGGEEFLITFKNSSLKEAEANANNLRTIISNVIWNYPDLHVTISGGIFSCKLSDNINIDYAVEHADKCLYRAKNDGRNCIVT